MPWISIYVFVLFVPLFLCVVSHTHTHTHTHASQILENEVKILRNESRTKAEAVTKMMIKTAQAINIRDQVSKLK